MTLDGHIIEPLNNGGCYVTTDGTRTFHADQEAAIRHVQRMAIERAHYEARRLKLVGEGELNVTAERMNQTAERLGVDFRLPNDDGYSASEFTNMVSLLLEKLSLNTLPADWKDAPINSGPI